MWKNSELKANMKVIYTIIYTYIYISKIFH